jgi:hypothetical protein
VLFVVIHFIFSNRCDLSGRGLPAERWLSVTPVRFLAESLPWWI